MTVCPYCGQNDLWYVSIADVDDNAVICCECDTVWKNQEEIVYGNGKNIDDFMESNGIKTDWQKIRLKSKLED